MLRVLLGIVQGDVNACSHGARDLVVLGGLVELAPTGATEAVVVPIALEHCHTRRADDDAAEWVLSRMRGACAELGTATRIEGRRLVVTLTAH